ncbi:hypothetical protein GCM10017044_24970 [Kordiimonas sediminis]|uniref:Beta-lactamase-related domain-containing protein n=1 Tax=Kordiimonas sediminis TaxID=1735581 RepID=A0A919E9Y2_9PROT|nr:serine hydrolase domain-containing protein [Kordiimonas sediminis]GHF28735.1 hypothetical protein GCM10017044_24970 [Kordiimonas sediminis]
MSLTFKNLFILAFFVPGLSVTDALIAEDSAESPSAAIIALEQGLRPKYGVKGQEEVLWSLKDRMAHYKVPAVSIAVAIDGKLAWAKAYGVRSSATGKPVDTESLFQAASISKPIAGLGALRLVEEGALQLDTPVNAQLKNWKIVDNDFTKKSPVTLRHLLSHRSGATVHGFRGYAIDEEIPTTVEILNGAAPANSAPVVIRNLPGAAYKYSGGGYTIMQLLMEDTFGESFTHIIQEKILNPAGMLLSRYERPDDGGNYAVAHTGRDSSPLNGEYHLYPEYAAAGLWTTPSELVHLGSQIAQARNNEDGLISQNLLQEMIPDSAEENGLGFGLNNDGDGVAFVHSGRNVGFTARWITYADGRASVAVMTNADTGHDLIAEILSGLGNIYGWKQDAYTEFEVVSLNKEQLDAVAGTYKFSAEDDEAAIEITAESGMLWAESVLFQRSRFHAISDSRFFLPSGLTFELKIPEDGSTPELIVMDEIHLIKADQ